MPDPRVYNEARALIKAGCNVTLLCWDRGEGKPAQENIDGINVKRVFVKSTHARGASQIRFLRKFWDKAQEEAKNIKFDIIHAHDFDTLPLGYKLAKKYKKKIIFDSHEIYSSIIKVNALVKSGVYFLEDYYAKRVDCIFITCPQMKQRYKKAKYIEVIGNYRDPKDFEFTHDIISREKEKLGIKNQIVISYVANLGRERIIEPLLNVVKDDKSFFLLIGGEGIQAKSVEEYSNKYQNIKYLGFVKADKVPLYTALGDIIYYGYDSRIPMSRYASPNKLFEAIAAGKALLCANIGELGQIVREEDCGIALDVMDENTIKAALEEFKKPERLDYFKKRAIEASKKYNWQDAEKRILDTYRKLLEN